MQLDAKGRTAQTAKAAKQTAVAVANIQREGDSKGFAFFGGAMVIAHKIFIQVTLWPNQRRHFRKANSQVLGYLSLEAKRSMPTRYGRRSQLRHERHTELYSKVTLARFALAASALLRIPVPQTLSLLLQVPLVCKSWLAAAQVRFILFEFLLSLEPYNNLGGCQAPSLHRHALMHMPSKTNASTLIQVTMHRCQRFAPLNYLVNRACNCSCSTRSSRSLRSLTRSLCRRKRSSRCVGLWKYQR